jgi:hypothetical protein
VLEPIMGPTVPEPRRSDSNGTPVVSIDSHEGFRRGTVPIEEIYHSPELIGSPYLRNALRSILIGMESVNNALELLAAGDRVGADDAMQHYQVLLPELFACRSIGEGFGLLVSSLQNASSRLHGQPMEERQVRAVRLALIALRSEPFMTFDAAIAHVSRLEQVDLNVHPPKFENLADLLSE